MTAPTEILEDVEPFLKITAGIPANFDGMSETETVLVTHIMSMDSL